jgi:two-component system phosphate regulon sensor histidine kinase PhoR
VKGAAQYAPAAIIAPLLFMCSGAFVLQRMVRPVSGIELQLRQLALADATAATPLAPIEGTGAAAVGWNRLIDQRRAAQQKTGLESRLSQALEGFQRRKSDQILNSLPDGVALTDEEGRITFANQAMATLLGLGMDGETLRGKDMSECLRVDPSEERVAALSNPDSRQRTVVVEIGRSGDMSQGVLRVARHPVQAANQCGHVWSIRDITQQKLAEQMRNQFVNSATHELRTPLSNIKAYAETLALSDLDVERQKEFCNTINSEATRLARFIDDLLSISSMEAGALALARQETDTERMLREAVEKVRPQMTQKRITLNSSLPEKLPKLKLDKDKIIATLVNLMGNAAKYTPDGGQVNLRVRVKDNHLEIDVEDTGIGISAEDLPKVFEKFFRSSDPRVQQKTGTGLGLSLAQEVIRLHGGRLSVHSELNKGTRFTVSLPLAQGA